MDILYRLIDYIDGLIRLGGEIGIERRKRDR